MERYNEYKDSGVQWLGEIPSHWECEKAKRHFQSRKQIVGRNSSQYERLALTLKGVIKRFEGDGVGLNPEKLDTYQIVDKDDLIFKLIDLENVSTSRVGLSPYKGIVSPAYIRISAVDEVNIRFAEYYYLNMWMRHIFNDLGTPGVRSNLSSTDLLNLPLLYPSIVEQKAIASYLDKATAKIDEAIAQQQKMIDLLNERKQIIINNAVTKGLNPDAPMKDSGVDWIGEIPEHWEVRKLKHIAKLKSGDTISSDSFTEDGFPVYGGNGFRGYTNRFTNDGEYVLIGRQGALCGNVNYATGKFFASEHAVVVYPYDHENVAWLGEVIRASNLNQYSQSAAQPGLAVSVIENIAYPYPPEKERTAIAEYLAQQMNAINAALHNIERQISLLQERKQIIINDVVTGKVKVS